MGAMQARLGQTRVCSTLQVGSPITPPASPPGLLLDRTVQPGATCYSHHKKAGMLQPGATCYSHQRIRPVLYSQVPRATATNGYGHRLGQPCNDRGGASHPRATPTTTTTTMATVLLWTGMEHTMQGPHPPLLLLPRRLVLAPLTSPLSPSRVHSTAPHEPARWTPSLSGSTSRIHTRTSLNPKALNPKTPRSTPSCRKPSQPEQRQVARRQMLRPGATCYSQAAHATMPSSPPRPPPSPRLPRPAPRPGRVGGTLRPPGLAHAAPPAQHGGKPPQGRAQHRAQQAGPALEVQVLHGCTAERAPATATAEGAHLHKRAGRQG